MKATVALGAVLVTVSTNGHGRSEPTDAVVRDLIGQIVVADTEKKAFGSLESLGEIGVPFIIGQMDDSRPLPVKQISLVNKSPQAFEGLRHYSPGTVHDALSAILNQITGESFEIVYNGSSAEVRERNTLQWRAWCKGRYPQYQRACRGAF